MYSGASFRVRSTDIHKMMCTQTNLTENSCSHKEHIRHVNIAFSYLGPNFFEYSTCIWTIRNCLKHRNVSGYLASKDRFDGYSLRRGRGRSKKI